MFDDDIRSMAEQVVQTCRNAGLTLGTAESCTGGLIGGAVTAVAGSSEVFKGGYITYSNDAKMRDLGVTAAQLREYGAVSPQVAAAMAEGALKAGKFDISVAVTGIAGPDGGSADKPVGLVQFASAIRGADGVTVTNIEEQFGDIGRENVRRETVRSALKLVIQTLKTRA